MRKHKVIFLPQASSDLLTLFFYIAEESGLAVADAYIDRIEAACLALEQFPMRGTLREDIGPGLRILGFERRVSILFRVWKAAVEIVRILYGGRDYGHLLSIADT